MGNPYASKKSQKSMSTEPPEPTVALQSSVEPQDETPDGTINEVLEWVGNDTDRANRALEKELEDKGRKTLIDALEDQIEG